MKKSCKIVLIVELLISFFLILNFFIPNVFNSYIYVLFLLGIGLVLFAFLGFDTKKNIYQKRVLTNILIVLVTYFLVTYLIGLIVGFNKTVYNGFSTTNIFKNILPTVLIIILTELIRFIMINKTDKNKYLTILSCLVFILFNASFNYKFYDLKEYNDLFQYIGM